MRVLAHSMITLAPSCLGLLFAFACARSMHVMRFMLDCKQQLVKACSAALHQASNVIVPLTFVSLLAAFERIGLECCRKALQHEAMQ